MLDLGFVGFLTIWSAGVGLWTLRRLGSTPEHRFDALALAVPLGLGLLGLATLGLAECSMLNRMGLAIVLAIGAALGWRGGRLSEMLPSASGFAGLFARRRPHPSPALRAPSPGGRGECSLANPLLRPPDLLVGLALLAAVLGTLLTALTPVTDGDALCYHLQVPKLFLWRGAAVFDPDLHETIYPLLTEALYAVALAFRGPVACRLVHWVLGLVLAANVTALARPSLGPRAWWAGAITLLVPAVSNSMGAPLNDASLAAFGTAALVAWARFHDGPSARGAALVGLLAGLALGVKYPALVWTGLLGLAIVASSLIRLQHIRICLKHLSIFSLTAILVGGGWYLRALVHTGNPVYPFFRQVFGGAGLDEVLDPIKRPLAVSAWNLLTAMGPMTLEPDRFDSFSHQFGPVFLLFLPALALERAPRRVLGIAGLGYAMMMLCWTQRQSMRFVLIGVGPLAVAVAWLASTWWERRSTPGRILVAVLVLALGFEASLALARARHGIGVVVGRETGSSYLTRREPTFRVARWVDGHLPPEARIVGQDHRGYYFPRDYTMELAHRRRTGLGTRGESATEVVSRLRAAGFTHVLLAPPIPESAVEFDPTLGRLLAPWLAGRPPLYRAEIADPDGVVRRYEIHELSPRVATRLAGKGRR